MERVIQNAIDAGVYVIVDWHDHAAHEHEAEAVAFFLEMARKWGDYPHIIWETFNEPVHEVDWLTLLKPYHEAAVAAIREHDPDNLIVLGNPFWSQRPNEPLLTGIVTDAGVEPAVVEGDNIMYTLHFYACTHGADVRANGQAALDAGIPVFVTEWGATTADGGILAQGGRFCEAEGTEWMDWMTENRISWAAWRLQACSDISCILTPGAAYSGEWTDDDLNGHGAFVVDSLLD
jgi:endoglucanase